MKDIYRENSPESQLFLINQSKPQKAPKPFAIPRVTFPTTPKKVDNGRRGPDGKNKPTKTPKNQPTLWPK